MDYYQNQEQEGGAPKTYWWEFLIGVFFMCIVGVTAYGIFWYINLPIIPDNYETVFVKSIKDADPRIIETIPPASVLSNKTNEDAQKLFSASRVSTVFDFSNRTSEYLVRILDSTSQEFEVYKSIAGYFLAHSFYDSGGSITFMADAIGSSRFMDGITKKAKDVFPGLSVVPLNKMTYPEKSLYFTSYLIAMSDRGDSVAIPGNAVLELSRAYIQMSKYSDSSLYKSVAISAIENELHNQFGIVLGRLEKRRQSDYVEQTGFSHDTLVGLNLTSVAIDSLRQFGVADAFPEIRAVDTSINFADSHQIAKNKVSSLFMFTNYLYMRHMAIFSKETPENNAKIEELVKNMIGVSPYEKISEYSWIIKTMKKVDNSNGTYSLYTAKDISTIAKRSENFRGYLKAKGYSYILDGVI